MLKRDQGRRTWRVPASVGGATSRFCPLSYTWC